MIQDNLTIFQKKWNFYFIFSKNGGNSSKLPTTPPPQRKHSTGIQVVKDCALIKSKSHESELTNRINTGNANAVTVRSKIMYRFIRIVLFWLEAHLGWDTSMTFALINQGPLITDPIFMEFGQKQFTFHKFTKMQYKNSRFVSSQWKSGSINSNENQTDGFQPKKHLYCVHLVLTAANIKSQSKFEILSYSLSKE